MVYYSRGIGVRQTGVVLPKGYLFEFIYLNLLTLFKRKKSFGDESLTNGTFHFAAILMSLITGFTKHFAQTFHRPKKISS